MGCTATTVAAMAALCLGCTVLLVLIMITRRRRPIHVFDADGTLWPGDIAETYLAWRDARHGTQWSKQYEALAATQGFRRAFPWVEEQMASLPDAGDETAAFVEWARTEAPLLQPFPTTWGRALGFDSCDVFVLTASPERLVRAWLAALAPHRQWRVRGMRADSRGRVQTSTFREGKARVLQAKARPIASYTGNSWTDYEAMLWSDDHGAHITVVNPSSQRASPYGSFADAVASFPRWEVLQLADATGRILAKRAAGHGGHGLRTIRRTDA